MRSSRAPDLHEVHSPDLGHMSANVMDRVNHADHHTAAIGSTVISPRPPEVAGLGLDMFARGVIFMSSIFLGPALLEQATNDAALHCNEAIASDCRIYGFRPSSLLSNMATVSGLLATVFLPLFGAIMDHTSHRLQIGKYTAYGLVTIKAMEIAVGPGTWFWISCLQVLTALLYQPHIAATYAYTSELVKHDPREAGPSCSNQSDPFLASLSTKSSMRHTEQHCGNNQTHTHYNTLFTMVQQVSFLTFCIAVLGFGTLFNASTLLTARISQTITSITAGPIFYIAWNYYFRPCPQLKPVPAGKTLWECGVVSVQTTLRTIVSLDQTGDTRTPSDDSGKGYGGPYSAQCTSYRLLQYLLGSILFSEAASQALVAIATTFMTTVLHLDASAIGSVFLAVLVCGIVGAKIGAVVAELLGDSTQEFGRLEVHRPVRSAMGAQIYFCVVTTLACFFLNESASAKPPMAMPLLFGALWGVALGWLSPMHTSAFMGLVHGKPQQQAEMMGVYLLACSLLSWLPTLVFTILNELGGNMKWGLASLNVYFLFGLACLYRMGHVHSAITAAEEGDRDNAVAEELELKTKFIH